MSIPIVKSGWLLRLSTVLKRWKRNYFALFADGNLSYYEDESRREKHGNINLLFNGSDIKTALECGLEPAQGRTIGCLMTIVCKDRSEVTICAETNDECLAWKMMVEQPMSARARDHHRQRQQAYPQAGAYPPPYSQGQYPAPVPGQQYPVYNYPNYGPVQVWYTAEGKPYYVHPQTRVIHVIHDNDPYYYRGSGMVTGIAAGALLGAALWSPFFFFC